MNHSYNGKCILLIFIFSMICSASFARALGDRQIENLGRGVIAINEGGDIYIGWRMLGTDPAWARGRRARQAGCWTIF